MKTLSIIPAGGTGRRMGGAVPKQYLLLAGIPVLARTLRLFQDSPGIDEITLAVPEADIHEVRCAIVEKYGLSKVGLVLAGGRERQDSVRNALLHVRADQEIIVVHDGVRPFITALLIERVVAAARRYGAVSVGVPVKDTVKEVNTEGWVEKTLSRQRLWLTQTPQAFHREILLAAYKKAEEDGVCATDDASLVERLGTPVRMIPGDEANIKLTTAEDMILAEGIVDRFFFNERGTEG
jgi:2-C-methyl-D-erythritol 4-phosphate cytidylyltransferase